MKNDRSQENKGSDNTPKEQNNRKKRISTFALFSGAALATVWTSIVLISHRPITFLFIFKSTILISAEILLITAAIYLPYKLIKNIFSISGKKRAREEKQSQDMPHSKKTPNIEPYKNNIVTIKEVSNDKQCEQNAENALTDEKKEKFLEIFFGNTNEQTLENEQISPLVDQQVSALVDEQVSPVVDEQIPPLVEQQLSSLSDRDIYLRKKHQLKEDINNLQPQLRENQCITIKNQLNTIAKKVPHTNFLATGQLAPEQPPYNRVQFLSWEYKKLSKLLEMPSIERTKHFKVTLINKAKIKINTP